MYTYKIDYTKLANERNERVAVIIIVQMKRQVSPRSCLRGPTTNNEHRVFKYRPDTTNLLPPHDAADTNIPPDARSDSNNYFLND